MEDKQERCIITMTTWTKRITNIPAVLDSIIKNQTFKPDLVNLNISIEEFPKRESSFPSEVQKYIKENEDIISINWIEGPNTKQWKKIIPTLFKYPNDCIICIDDDWIYHNTFIEDMLNAHKQYPDNPVTMNRGYSVKGFLQHCGKGTLDKLEYYNGFEGIDLEELYKNYSSSDTFFNYLAAKCGHKIKFNGAVDRSRKYNEVFPLSKLQNTSSASSHHKLWDFLSAKYGRVEVDDKKKQMPLIDSCLDISENIVKKPEKITVRRKIAKRTYVESSALRTFLGN